MFHVMLMGHPGLPGDVLTTAADIHMEKHKRPIHSGEWREVKPYLRLEAEIQGKSEDEALRDAAHQSLLVTAVEIRKKFELLSPEEDVLKEVRRQWGNETYETITGRTSRGLPQKEKVNPSTLHPSTDRSCTAQEKDKTENDKTGEFYRAEMEAVGFPMPGEPMELWQISADGMTGPEATFAIHQVFDRLQEKLTKGEEEIVQALLGGANDEEIMDKFKLTRDAWYKRKERIKKKISAPKK
jgi:hypothetical protein